MKKIKRFGVVFLSLLFALSLSSVFTACKDKKYDVTIKIINNLGDEWIFTPDITEMTYEFEYTGEEMKFYIDSYNLADHPRWGDRWFAPASEGANTFTRTMTYRGEDGEKVAGIRPVKEKGEYCIHIIADSTSNLWKFRGIYLYVKII